MADVNDGEIADLYPPPPPYYKFFTPKNLEKAREWEQTHDNTEYPEDETQFLIPPKKPEGPIYRIFGNAWHFEDKLPTLTEMGVQKLYSDADEEQKSENEDEDASGDEGEKAEGEKDVAKDLDEISSARKIDEFKKLFKSLLLNFLELIGIISKNPTYYPEKLEQIRTILINIHHLINEYRPHQARESLILMLNNQINHKKNEIKQIEQSCAMIEEKLQKITQEIELGVSGVKTGAASASASALALASASTSTSTSTEVTESTANVAPGDGAEVSQKTGNVSSLSAKDREIVSILQDLAL